MIEGLKPRHLYVLLKIFLSSNGKSTTLSELSTILKFPKQTVSRWVSELSNLGYIEAKRYGRNLMITLSDDGLSTVRTLYMILRSRFEGLKYSIVISGIVVKGIGDGRYYLSIPEYRNRLKELLGYYPFPGTLNLKLNSSEDYSNLRLFLSLEEPLYVESFEAHGRIFGGVKCYPVLIDRKIKGHLIFPERSHHDNTVIEIISMFKLRDKLNLKNGSLVKVYLVSTSPAGLEPATYGSAGRRSDPS